MGDEKNVNKPLRDVSPPYPTASNSKHTHFECTIKIIIYDNFTIRIYLTEFILLHKKIPTSVGILSYLIPNAILAYRDIRSGVHAGYQTSFTSIVFTSSISANAR